MMKMDALYNMKENVRGKIVEAVSQKVISFGDPMELLGDKCIMKLFFEPEMPEGLLKIMNEE